jgi:glutamate-1-semialdehyde aminotransferase
MPGGVSSPVRAFKSVGGNPIVFDRVKGAYTWDVDDNKYIDYVCTWGPAILGHADDDVLAAVKKTMDKGTSFGAPCSLKNELAKAVIAAVPSVEMVRFTKSGTEACMGMLRLVRAHTNREKSSSSRGATTDTPTLSWSKPDPVLPLWVFLTLPVSRVLPPSPPSAPNTTTWNLSRRF